MFDAPIPKHRRAIRTLPRLDLFMDGDPYAAWKVLREQAPGVAAREANLDWTRAQSDVGVTTCRVSSRLPSRSRSIY